MKKIIAAVLLSGCFSVAVMATEQDRAWDEAVYQQETVGDLEQAAKLYTNIIEATADRQLKALSMIRLAQCLEQLGEVDRTNTLYQELKQSYLDVDDVAAYFNQEQQSEFLTADELLAEPWSHGEVLDFEMLQPDGRLTGYTTMVKLMQNAQALGDHWLTHVNFVSSMANQLSHQEVRSRVDDAGFISLTKSIQGITEFNLINEGEKVSFEHLYMGQKYDFEPVAHAFSGIQLDDLVRRLPYKQNYETKIKAYYAGNLGYFIIDVKVLDDSAKYNYLGEDIPAWKINIKLKVETGELVYEQTGWIDQSEKRLPLRFTSKVNDVVLVGASSQSALEETKYLSSDNKLNIKLPVGWKAYDVTGRNDESQKVAFFPFDFNSSMTLGWKKEYEFDWDKADLSDKTEDSIKWAKSFYKTYKVDESSRQLTHYAGMPSARHLGSWTHNKWETVEDRVWIQAEKPKIYSLVFYTSKDLYKIEKSEFDQILSEMTKE
ncbi:tol-pal system YbgF family protein [Agaribacterium sp. ZY112]|uniref:tetratricopeptide repeat protein n=1 Tax=Agaribacterium sp. ZY112 TaxID=3233574 RepID=UPI003523E34F